MKTLLTIRSSFRVALLITLVFRLFFVENLNLNLDIASYVSLAICVIGAITMEIVIFMYKKRRGL